MSPITFDPSKDIPDLSGKIILITGGTAGLGKETALSFAAHNASHIYFTGRSQSSADALIQAVSTKYPQAKITFLQCDLASLASVQATAKRFLEANDRLDILFCNAGVMALPPGQTKDGYEVQFGTNHVGHALLLKLLTPLLEKTAAKTHDVRIVFNTSLGYPFHPKGGILFDKLKTPQRDIALFMGHWVRYGQSKLANLLYARAYAQHHSDLTCVSVHPGISATGLVTSMGLADRWFVYIMSIGKMISPEECAYNQQWAATAEGVESGCYYEPVGVKGELQGEAGNDELAEKLWEWTQSELASDSV